MVSLLIDESVIDFVVYFVQLLLVVIFVFKTTQTGRYVPEAHVTKWRLLQHQLETVTVSNEFRKIRNVLK